MPWFNSSESLCFIWIRRFNGLFIVVSWIFTFVSLGGRKGQKSVVQSVIGSNQGEIGDMVQPQRFSSRNLLIASGQSPICDGRHVKLQCWSTVVKSRPMHCVLAFLCTFGAFSQLYCRIASNFGQVVDWLLSRAKRCADSADNPCVYTNFREGVPFEFIGSSKTDATTRNIHICLQSISLLTKNEFLSCHKRESMS